MSQVSVFPRAAASWLVCDEHEPCQALCDAGCGPTKLLREEFAAARRAATVGTRLQYFACNLGNACARRESVVAVRRQSVTQFRRLVATARRRRNVTVSTA